jgi:hypothetical protein
MFDNARIGHFLEHKKSNILFDQYAVHKIVLFDQYPVYKKVEHNINRTKSEH